MLENAIQVFLQRSKVNNYKQIDELNDNLAILTGGNINNRPIFYHSNMIIVRKSFIKQIIRLSRTTPYMRAVIYVIYCLLSLHAPVLPKDAIISDWNLCDYTSDSIHIKKLRQIFGIHRNTLSKALKTLQELSIVQLISDNNYTFSFTADINENKWSLSALHEQLETFMELVIALQHAELIGNIIPDDYDSADNAAFPDDDEAAYIIHSITNDKVNPKWSLLLDKALKQTNDIFGNDIAKLVMELFKKVPYVSSYNDFVFIRQEYLEYILLHGYRIPLTDNMVPLSKQAFVVLNYMMLMSDVEGYIYKNSDYNDTQILQMKDIAIDCKLSKAAVSQAVRELEKNMLIVKTNKGFCFNNRLNIITRDSTQSYVNIRNSKN